MGDKVSSWISQVQCSVRRLQRILLSSFQTESSLEIIQNCGNTHSALSLPLRKCFHPSTESIVKQSDYDGCSPSCDWSYHHPNPHAPPLWSVTLFVVPLFLFFLLLGKIMSESLFCLGSIRETTFLWVAEHGDASSSAELQAELWVVHSWWHFLWFVSSCRVQISRCPPIAWSRGSRRNAWRWWRCTIPTLNSVGFFLTLRL